MEIKNLTPHSLTIIDENGKVIATIPSEGRDNVARVTMTREQKGKIGDIPIFSVSFGEVEGLPDQEEGTIYVVSSIVASKPSLRGRNDIFVPGDLVRDDQGRVIGARGLARSG